MTTENIQETETQSAEPKTFTQDEVNQIVQERLFRAKKDYGDYEELKQKAAKLDELEEKSKSELQKTTERADALQKELEGLKKANSIREVRDKVSKETGIPTSLLSADTEEACQEQAKALLAFRDSNKPGYPVVKDAGEVTITNKGTTAEQFADWLNSNLKK